MMEMRSVYEILVGKPRGNFLTCLVTRSFSRIVFHGISWLISYLRPKQKLYIRRSSSTHNLKTLYYVALVLLSPQIFALSSYWYYFWQVAKMYPSAVVSNRMEFKKFHEIFRLGDTDTNIYGDSSMSVRGDSNMSCSVFSHSVYYLPLLYKLAA